MRTFGEHYLPELAIPISTASNDRTGGTIDLKNYQGVAFLLDIAAVGAGAVHDLTIEASDDGATWFTLDGPSYAIRPGSAAQAIIDIRRPLNRYIRVAIAGDDTVSVMLSVTAFKYGPPSLPVAYPGGGLSPDLLAYRSPLPAA